MTSTAALVRTGEPPELPSGVTAPRAQLQLLRPIAQPGDIIKVQDEVRRFVHEALKEGRDYGKIPGTDKNVLLKPGSERVANGFGCSYGEPVIVDKEIDHDREVKWKTWSKKSGAKQGTSFGLYRYVLKVPVVELSSGKTVGWGAGAASTMESKYVSRPRECENTVFKMAAKRARIDACLTTFGLSEEFTQDVDDAPEREEAEPDDLEELVPRAITLEQAEELPFFWPTHKKYGRKPLKDVPTSMLLRVRDWFRQKMNVDEITVERLTNVKALELIVAARERGERTDPTSGTAATPAAAPATRNGASNASSTSAPSTSSASSPNTSPALGDDGLDDGLDDEERYGAELPAAPKPPPNVPPPANGAPDSVYALTREVRTLLEDPRVPASTRSEIKRALVEKGGPGQSPAWLAQQRDDLKALLPTRTRS